MKKMVALTIFALSASCFAQDTYVQGHYRNDGSYVQGHYRSHADGNPYNNYSTRGNTNPYTGERGYQSPNNNNYGSHNNYGGSNYHGQQHYPKYW